ncbi:trigger factor [Oribacterium sp. P9]|uniref:trigger factor n=1 Tax=unclassified Oribacterium TaxID=2629782 RepID=UPI002A791356|nr:trigger factor [Oribacterium sp.]MDY2854536.1 trigger factor [Oliverpabstia sp.]
MSVKVENLEKNMAKLTVEVDNAEFLKAIDVAYKKNRNKFNLPGFRKGKAPKEMIMKMYGPQVFFEDALNEILDKTYPEAAKESGLEIVSRPEIGVEQIGMDQNVIYTATVAVKPEVTLGEYKGVTVEKAETTVSAKEVNEKLAAELEKNARVVEVDREIKKDDIANIDFVGSVDGVEFEGGKGEDYPLTIGSGTFIPGFEDQLIGHKAGETVDVKVTFPENYGAKDLAGKEALFVTTIKTVKEKQVPAADDEFASEVSEFDTLDEYKKDLKKTLKEEKEKAATTTNERNVIAKVVENASVEIPAPMLEAQLDNMLYDYQTRLAQQGIPMDQYLKITGQTVEQIKDQMKESAEKNLKTSLVIEAIMEKENITVAEERVDEEFKKIAEQYKMEYDDLKKTVSEEQKESMKREIAFQETIDMLVAEANLVKAEKKSKKAAEDEEKTEE